MLSAAFLSWFGQIVPTFQDASISDLSDGYLLGSLLHIVNPKKFPEMEGSSPQKNFQLDLRNIRNLINNLQAELTTELAIDALRIAKNKDENEIMKLLDVIAKYLVETERGQDTLQGLPQETILCLAENCLIRQEQPPHNGTLLEKIDELESENQRYKEAATEAELRAKQLRLRLLDCEKQLKQRENEINELKQVLSNRENSLEIHADELLTGLRKQLSQYARELEQSQRDREVLEAQLRAHSDLEQLNKQLQQELALRNKSDKQLQSYHEQNQIFRETLERKEEQIQSLQRQLKRLSQEKCEETNRAIQIELENEKIKQQMHDLELRKNREVYELRQQVSELQQMVDREQASQETFRTQTAPSPRNCLETDLYSIIENSGGYMNEQMMQDLQVQMQQKEQLNQQKLKTLESALENMRQKYVEQQEENSVLVSRIKGLNQEMEKICEKDYNLQSLAMAKQQNMLLVSVIDALRDQIVNGKHLLKTGLPSSTKPLPSHSCSKPTHPFKTANH